MEDASAQETTGGVPSISTGQWLAGYLAAWLVMLAPILALDTISQDHPFVVLVAGIWLAAFPVSFLLRRRRVTRSAVNVPIMLLCFVLAVPIIVGRLGIRIAAVGIDTASIDPGQSPTFDAHRILFARNIPGFENVADLDRLPAVGATVIALPMKIEGGSGGPLRIVALLP